MLIIFDLDDTLIDTSGAITPYKLQQALQLMIGHASKEELEIITQINLQSAKTALALHAYGAMRGVSSATIAQAVALLSKPLPDDFPVPCTPYAKEILQYYASRGPIALVTGGYPPFQKEKLKKAGIEPSIFSKIAIPEDSLKGPFYRDFLREFSVDPDQVWVCGDRVAMDLAPAHALGCKTVLMRWGRGLQMPHEPWIDHSIRQLTELRNIIP